MRRRAEADLAPTTRNKGVDWDAAPLGEMSDGEIAKMYGVAQPVVCNARNRRGIAPFSPRCAAVDWASTPLGELPDAALAERLGVSQPTVTRHRNRLGIPPFKATFLTPEGQAADSYPEALIDLFWHEQRIPHEFQVPIGPYIADWVLEGDTVVEYAGFLESRVFGEEYRRRLEAKVAFYKSAGWEVRVLYPADLAEFRPQGSPQTTRDLISGEINWSQQPLGEMSDTALASRLGVAQPTVTRWRNILGLAPYTPCPDWSLIPLGLEFDTTIAKRLEVSKETVRRARVGRGIPSYRSTRRAA